MLKDLLSRFAPVHGAEPYVPGHDGTLNLVEARRGRGKSYGAVEIACLWLEEVMPGILAGVRPHSRIYTNNRFDLVRLAYHLLRKKIFSNLEHAVAVLRERVVYVTGWMQILTAYDSLILMDEANRNLNTYDNGAAAQKLMLLVHDWLQQTRKHKLTLWFFVQYLDWIKPQLRFLMDRLWRAKVVRDKKKPGKPPKYFPWYGSDPFGNGVGAAIVRRADFKLRFDFDIRRARIYNSWQAIETLEGSVEVASFGELSAWMLERGMKPGITPEPPERMTWSELHAWTMKLDTVAGPLWWVSPAVSPPLPPPAGGGGGGVAGGPGRPLSWDEPGYVPPVLDLSQLPVSFPRASS